MSNEELSPEALAAIERIGKLLALAKDTRGNEAEAQNAMDAALKLLEKHNLDMALVERTKGNAGHAKRQDKSSGGGLYKWQRTLWNSVAGMNMCVYFSIRGLERGSKYENRLVGRAENVLAATLMAQYLQDTVERMAAEWVKDNYETGTSRFIQSAIIWREGAAERLSSRLWDLRWEREAAAREQKADAFKAAGGENALVVITDVIQDEADLNNDYLHGLDPGTTKARRMERERVSAIWQAEQAEKKRLHESRMLIDPEYAAKARLDEAIANQENAKAQQRYDRAYRPRATRETAEDRRRSTHAFRAGYHAASDIGLDQQVGGKSKPHERIG